LLSPASGCRHRDYGEEHPQRCHSTADFILGGTKQAEKLVVCPPMFAHDVDRIEENLQGDGFFTLEIRVEIGKRNVQRSGKTLFRSEDLQSAAHCRQCH